MQFLTKQKEFLRDVDTFILGYVAGFGAGKTWAGCQKALMLSIINHGLAGMMVSPTFSMMRDTTRRTFLELLEEREINFSFKATENKVILSDIGSEVWFRSGDDANKLKGSNLAWVGLDEPALMGKDVLDIAISRAREPKAKKRQIFLTGTPEGFNWLYDLFKEETKNRKMISSSTAENTFLPPEYIQNLYDNYDSKLVQQYIEGKFVNINQGQVYYSFSRETHVKPLNYKGGDIYLTFDFNIDPMTTSICQVLHGYLGEQDKVIHVLKAVNSRNGNTDSQCKEIKRIFEELNFNGNLYITGDASHPRSTTSNRTDWEIIKEHFPAAEFILRKSNPAIQDRVNSVNAKLKNAKGEIGVYIDTNAVKMIQDLEQVSWKEGTRDIDKTNKELTHNSDNLGYLIYNLFPITSKGKTEINSYR